jgi:hypothetical protein
VKCADDRYAVVRASITTATAIATSTPTATIAVPNALPACESRGLLCSVDIVSGPVLPCSGGRDLGAVAAR